MNDAFVRSVVDDLESISQDAADAFGNLTTVQLNWKSDAKSWSVAQCLDHLIVIDSLYFPLFEKLRRGKIENTFWQKISPFSGFFGRELIKRLSPEYEKKTKTSAKAMPSSSEYGGDIVERFREHQLELAGHIANISSDVAGETIITSPLAGFVTYSLSDCVKVLVVHEQRHMLQAKRVMENEGFPA